MIDTTDRQTVFPLSAAQNEGIMNDAERLRGRVGHWMEHGGREELAAALKRCKEAGQAIREALRPDPEILRKPTTI